VIVLFILVVYLGTIFFVTQDPLWFVSSFNEKPVHIVVYHDGEKSEYRVGDPGLNGWLKPSARAWIKASCARAVLAWGRNPPGSLCKICYGRSLLQPSGQAPRQLLDRSPDPDALSHYGRHSELGVVFLGEGGITWVNPPA